jgi:CheY-like chemotaxis protein
MPPPTASPALASLLVVDDNLVQRMQVVALCRELGVEMIYEAASGAEALELLAMLVLPPDMAIIDLEMPVMDGVELIEQMKERQLSIPLIEGRLVLGTWQGIYLFEHRRRPHRRTLALHVIGE